MKFVVNLSKLGKKVDLYEKKAFHLKLVNGNRVFNHKKKSSTKKRREGVMRPDKA